LEDRFAVTIVGEVGAEPEDKVEGQESERDIGQIHTEVTQHADQSCEDDNPCDIQRVSL